MVGEFGEPVEYGGEAVCLEPLLQATLTHPEDMMITLPLVVEEIPSKKLQADMREHERSRVQKLKERLGEEIKVTSAPNSLLTSLPIPSSRLFHKVTSVNSDSPNQQDDFDLKQMQVFVQFNQTEKAIFFVLLTMVGGRVF